jgi:hypothetical protein
LLTTSKRKAFSMPEFCDSENTNQCSEHAVTSVIHPMCTHRNEYVEKIFQGGQLWNKFLHYFAEGFEYGVVIDTGEIEAEMANEEAINYEMRRIDTVVLVSVLTKYYHLK